MEYQHILANYDFSQVQVLKSVIPLLAIGLAIGAISLAVGIYTFLQMRKMQKKNRPKPSQIDGTIADEGTSFMDIAGSPHMHGNIVEFISKQADPIKQKSGGFLGIGSSSQVVGYRYYTTFVMFIGNYVEDLIHIVFGDTDFKLMGTRVPVGNYGTLFYMTSKLSTSIYGEQGGGIGGVIRLMHGDKDQHPDPILQETALIRGDIHEGGFYCSYPYQSYLVFSGGTLNIPSEDITEEELQQMADEMNNGVIPGRGFYIGNSNYMKEMLLLVKRTRVRNDGRRQWYEVRGDGAVVCEVGALVIRSDKNFEESSFVWTLTTRATSSFNPDEPGVIKSVYYNKEALYSKEGDVASAYGGGIPADSWARSYAHYDMTNATGGYSLVEFQARAIGQHISLLLKGEIYNEKYSIETGLLNGIETRFYTGSFIVDLSEPFSISLTANGARYNENDSDGSVSTWIHDVYIYKPKKDAAIVVMSAPDINPIHKIREILTDDTAMAKPEADVNDINFKKAADRILDELLGVSWAIDEKSCIDAIEELCYHIEAGIRVNRQTGLYEMVLFRDDWFDEDEIHTIAENKIKDLSLEVMNSDDIVNQLNVTYYDRERIKNSTFSIYENGSILTMGKANAESIDFPYFMNMRNAEIVANWKLKQYSTPAWKGTFTTGWREARKWNRYDLVKINWSKKWQGTILARIMKIDLGNGLNNEVMIDFEEVVPYSGEMNTSIVVDDSTEIKPMPPQSAIFKTFEIPYYDLAQLKTQAELDLELARNPNIGFVAAVAGRPQQNSIDAQLHTESDVGYELVSTVEYASFARTDEAVNKTQQSFVIKNEDLSVKFRQGSLVMLGDEIVIYKSYDAETKTLTVERGALDTIPQNHTENTVLYFYDDAFAYDPEGYTPPKTVNATVLTTTPSGIESLETSPKRQVEIESRAIRPYPPANVKFNDAYYPETIITTNDIVLTWLGRNRLANQVLDFYDSSNDAELNTTYSYELISEDVVLDSASGITGNTATILSSALIPNKPHTLKLWSVRDVYDSYQVFEHSFFAESASLILTAATDGSGVIGNTVPVANISVNVDESLSANMQFDGSAISGKAEAGATITIEIQE